MIARNGLKIPQSALTSKPYWPQEPEREVVDEIRQWIRDGNPSYLWRGHTHTEPPENSKIVFIGEFQLPEKLAENENNWYPCPCCHPITPWFKGNENRPGMIAWFPDEAVIRLIGYDCYSKINPEGHKDARQQWRKKKEFDGNIDFIAKNFHRIPKLKESISQNLKIAKALDHFHKLIHLKIKNLGLYGSINEISQGTLYLNNKKEILVRRADGSEQIQTDIIREVYATFEGKEMLDKNKKPLSPKLESALELLKKAESNLNDDTSAATHSEIKQIVTYFSRAETIAVEVENNLYSLKNFLGPITINTINAWGSHEGTPVELYIDRNGSDFLIGTDKLRSTKIIISSNLGNTIAVTPKVQSKNINFSDKRNIQQ